MENKPLKIISVEHHLPEREEKSTRNSMIRERKVEAQARFERLWKIDPEQFNPLRNCMERERLERTWDLLKSHYDPKGKFIVDLGCGSGVFSRRVRDAGASVQAVDIAENALKLIKEQNSDNIKTVQDYVPRTLLQDSVYDLVICMELIAELPSDEYRLLFSELARIVKRDGFILFSTSLDYHSIDALERLASLAETELQILDWTFSYHSLYLKLKDFLEVPKHFIKGWKDKDKRHHELKVRQGLNRLWYRLNTSLIFGMLWSPIEWLMRPLVKAYKQNERILLRIEKICRFISDRTGINHAIFIAKRRPLVPPNAAPISERPKKREVWE